MPKRKWDAEPEPEQIDHPSKKGLFYSLATDLSRFTKASSDLWEWARYSAQWPGADEKYYSPASWFWYWVSNRWTTNSTWANGKASRSSE